MNLLMIIQKVDRADASAGYSYGWVKKMGLELKAQRAKLYVICLSKDDLTGLPDNVEVYSLGKEAGVNKFKRYLKFGVLALKLVSRVDGIFCHQNSEYAIAITPFAKLFRKKVFVWQTQKQVNFKIKLMEKLVDLIFSASPETFPLISKKLVLSGQAIDIDFFKPPVVPYGSKFFLEESDPRAVSTFKILQIGRVDFAKKYETLIEAMDLIVNQKGIKDINLLIITGLISPENQKYFENIKKLISKKELNNYIEFVGTISNYETVKYYQNANLFIGLAAKRSVNRTVLEAMACGTIVLTSNQAFKEILPANLIFNPDNVNDLAEKIIAIKGSPEKDLASLKEKLRNEVVSHHNLINVVKKIINKFENL